MNNLFKKGFTLLEFLISISIFLLLVATSIWYLPKYGNNKRLEVTKQEITTILGEARSLAISSKGGSAHGVLIEANKVTIFSGNNFVLGEPSNKEFVLDPKVYISSVNLNGAGNEIIFARFTGETDQYGSMVLSPTDGESISKTITIISSGVVQ
jgi:prepilin-type N-terminal cleavage/methylation domain-containing protein